MNVAENCKCADLTRMENDERSGPSDGPLPVERTFCRACGLEVEKDADGDWRHIGITLRHPPVPEVAYALLPP